MPDGRSLDDYVDVEPLSPRVCQYECWHCGHTYCDSARKQASICPECLHGQGDDGIDYLDLWYPDVDRETAREKYAQVREDVRQRHGGHVEVRL